MPFRPVPGYYSLFLEFEDGTPATVVHNGYGYLSSYGLVPWAGRSRFGEEARLRRKALRNNQPFDDAAAKDAMRFGGKREDDFYGQAGQQESGTGFQGDLGIVVASCERGDIRQSPNGLWIYDEDGMREVAAIQQDRPVHHDGHWGMATLEVVLAIMQSGRERREIVMSHQYPAYE